MPPTQERLPGCKNLLRLCDEYPKPIPMIHTRVPTIRLPPPRWSSGPTSLNHPHPRLHYARLGVHHNQESTPGSSISKKRKDTFDREKQRRVKLESDPWSDKTRLTPKSVFCLGCKRDIKLDRRNDYYPGLWLKHRGLCQGIANNRARKSEVETASGSGESKQGKTSDSDSDFSMDSLGDDEQAARILIELKASSRRLDDSDSSSSCSDSA